MPGFVPDDFDVPAGLETPEFRVRQLLISDVVKDYDAVMSLDEAQCLGCLYINPTKLPGYQAEAFCWIRASHAAALDAKLYDALRGWLDGAWPFKAVAYPGRALTWAAIADLIR